MSHSRNRTRAFVGTVLAALASNAFAHAETGVAGGLISGFLHPIYGTDHLVAMVAVGLWGAVLGAPAVWVLPVAFPLLMALGALAGVAGLPLPGVELGVSASAIVLGLVVALKVRPPLAVAGLLVALFGLFHGYAHGMELPNAVNPLAYGIGFILCTGALHLAGILLGLLVHVPRGMRVVQGSGAVVAAAGVYFLGGNLGML